MEESPDEECPDIKSYSVKTDSFYSFDMVKNDHSTFGYKKKVEFPTFENTELLSPDEGSAYEMNVGPGDFRISTLRLDFRLGSSRSMMT